MSKEENTAIVPREAFMEMDRLDQQQIVLAATGEVIDELIYEVKGKWGLSWAGINHIAFWMGDIKVDPGVEWERIEMFGDRVYWSATVRAVNEKYNLASLGTAEVPEYMDVYDLVKGKRIPKRRPDGKGGFETHLEPDSFCRRKALSMAQRNAKRAVMPAAVLTKWLQYFKDTKQGKTVEAPFRPKSVESEFKVLEKPKTNRRRKKADEPEEPVVDSDAEKVKTILGDNGLSLDELSIYTYGGAVRIIPKPTFPQENFNEYSEKILKLLDAKWISADMRWDVVILAT